MKINTNKTIHFTILNLFNPTEEKGVIFMPSLFMSVDQKTQMALKFEVVHPHNVNDKIQLYLVELFESLKCIPHAVVTNNEKAAVLIYTFLQELNIKLYYNTDDELLDDICASFLKMQKG